MKSNLSDITKLLGKPQFEANSEKLFGYKTDNFYIFFTGNGSLDEVSIYRRDTKFESTSIKALIEEYKKHYADADYYPTSQLKQQWGDYDYGFGVSSVYCNLMYISRGVKLIDYDKSCPQPNSYITLYSNFIGDITPDISLPDKYQNLFTLSEDFIQLKLDKDFVFETEKERANAYSADKGDKRFILSPDNSKKISYSFGEPDSVNYTPLTIWYLDKSKPNKEIDDPINEGSFVEGASWISNRYFAYIYQESLNIYDTLLDKIIVIPADNGAKIAFDIKNNIDNSVLSTNNNKIVYFHDQYKITVTYNFNKNGEIKIIN